jgi:hypothetical protein
MIERCQHRRRKLEGIVAWYFEHVMESPPLMLQGALLLLGCVLSRYLWDVNTTAASVALEATSLGVIFYLFIIIIIAGAASQSCPYQTPGSRIFLDVWHKLPTKPYPSASALKDAIRRSEFFDTIVSNLLYFRPWSPRGKITPFLRVLVVKVSPAFDADIRAVVQGLAWSLPHYPRCMQPVV